jgi:hypothetical protein
MNNCKSYSNLKIDIPTLTGIMIEKFKQPSSCKEEVILWKNRDGQLQSFNGMPAFIRIGSNKIAMIWADNGKPGKEMYIEVKSKIDFIADKIKSRNFEQRAKGKK